MENEQEKGTQENPAEDLEFDIEESETKENKEKSETPKKEFSDEDKLERIERMRTKLLKKLGKDTGETKADEPKPKEKATKSGEFGYAEKAFLYATGIKGSDEVELAQEFMKNTGKSLEDVVDSKFFQAELKELREAKASAEAVPKGSKRSTTASKDSVDYWLAKGELPENTPENAELRRQVVNARIKKETSSNKFSTSSVGGVKRQSQMK